METQSLSQAAFDQQRELFDALIADDYDYIERMNLSTLRDFQKNRKIEIAEGKIKKSYLDTTPEEMVMAELEGVIDAIGYHTEMAEVLKAGASAPIVRSIPEENRESTLVSALQTIERLKGQKVRVEKLLATLEAQL